MSEKGVTRMRVAKDIGSPVLESLGPVLRGSRFVRTDARKIAEHAGWMAYEELPFPDFVLPFGVGGNRDEAIDFVMVSGLINFAFTDFRTRRVFSVEYGGKKWSDAEAMFACLRRAAGAVLNGRYGGKFHNYFRGGSRKLYDNERGMIERLVAEFPRFNDVSRFGGGTRLNFTSWRTWRFLLTAPAFWKGSVPFTRVSMQHAA